MTAFKSHSVVDNFKVDVEPPALMDSESYRKLLENLLGKGQGYGKTEPEYNIQSQTRINC